MLFRVLIGATILLAGALRSEPAHAVYITGTFGGTASGDMNNWNGTSTPFVEPVSGQFSLDMTLPDPGACCPYCCFVSQEPGSLTYQGEHLLDISIQAFGREISSTGNKYWLDSITLGQDGAGQSVTARGGGPYWGWSLNFINSDGGLFDDFDPATFDPAHVNIEESYATFSDDIRSYYARVTFDTVSFDGSALSVPEPSSVGLLALGALLLASARRKHRSGRYSAR